MKYIIVTFFLFTAFHSAFSQNDGVELYVGISGSMLRGEIGEDLSDASFSRRHSIYGGFLFSIPTGSFFTLKTGLGYSGRGADTNGEAIKLSYAEVPLLFSMGSEKVSFLIGPQVSLLLTNNFGNVKTLDVGMQYGLSVGLSDHFLCRAVFYHGFSSLVDYSDTNLTNRYIGIVIGYRLAPDKGAE